MCTATWQFTPAGYNILFNRDEQRNRLPASPPDIYTTGSSYYVAALDGNHHGTWLAANHTGCSVGLLNYYQKQDTRQTQHLSRGNLVVDLMSCINTQQIGQRLAAMKLDAYRAFMLCCWDKNDMQILAWDGVSLQPAPFALDEGFVSTSSVHSDSIVNSRRSQFQSHKEQYGSNLPERMLFHLSHLPAGGAESVCMHREDARTVSLTMLNVDDGAADMVYLPDSPCRSRTASRRRLRLEPA